MTIQVFRENFESVRADCSVVWVWEKNLENLADKEILQELGFKDMALVQGSKTLYVNVAQKNSDCLREGAYKAVRYLNALAYKSVKIPTFSDEELDYAITLGALSGSYEFDKYKSEKKPSTLQTLCFSNLSESVANKAQILFDSLKLVRDLVNTPPCDATPSYLAEISKSEAQKLGIECKVLDRKEIEKEKMHSLLSVARASSEEPKVIHLSYKPKNAKARLVFVGKGLTYDSGGLSLKIGRAQV